jgi:hypothetical protein
LRDGECLVRPLTRLVFKVAGVQEFSASRLHAVMAADEVAALLTRGRALLSEMRPDLCAMLFVEDGRVQYENSASPEDRAVLYRASTLARQSLGLPVKCWPCFVSGDPCTCDDPMSAGAYSVRQSTARLHTSNPMTMTPPS